MTFEKYHGLGNDYLVLDPAGCAECPDAVAIERICHRNYGLGSDGILYGPLGSACADFRLRILNPDGSEAEKSGNGLRIFARYLYDQARVAEGVPFSVETLGGVVRCVIGKGARDISVDMGTVRFTAADIPMLGPEGEVTDFPLEVGGETVRVWAANIGNPHCVVPMETVSREKACALGPLLERHPAFPQRTNVQLLQVIDRETIQIEIWERGAGYTLASGSSSSAAGAVARKMGKVGDAIAVNMPGGTIRLQIDAAYAVNMTGPVCYVGQMRLAHDFMETAPAALAQ